MSDSYFPTPKKVAVPPSTPHKAGAAGVGSAIGTAIGVAAVAWLKLEGELALSVIGACSALGAAVLAYVVRNYLTNPVAAAQTIAASVKAPNRTVIRVHLGTIFAALALLVLSACEVQRVSPAVTDTSALLRQVAVATIRDFNARGIDPLQLGEDKLVYLSGLCAAVSIGTAVVAPDQPELGEEASAWCLAVVEAAGAATSTPAPYVW